VSKALQPFGVMPLLEPIVGPPLRTLGGLILVYEVGSMRDVALEVREEWLVSQVIPRHEGVRRLAAQDFDGLDLRPQAAVHGIVRAEGMSTFDDCRLVRSAEPFAGVILAGGTSERIASNGASLPFERVVKDRPVMLNAMICGRYGWYQAGQRPPGATW
jgi:hypothetical protein